MFDVIAQPLSGLKVIRPKLFRDKRGAFVKTYNQSCFGELDTALLLKEEFYSLSHKDVIRGMHFQTPPHAHNKIVYCVGGSVLDVVVDMRYGLPSYGHTYSIELSAENQLILYIPIGFAHGFLSLAENTCMIYKTDCVYAPKNDKGILWNSFGFTWPVASPLLSERDQGFPRFDQSTIYFQ